MAAWIVVPCLEQLRAEFNEIAPDRDRASDGSIGDALHSSSSDHTPDEISDALRSRDADSRNEVHARDFDADLRVPGLSMEMVVQHILARCRRGTETRLRYIIWNRRIWSASNGWVQELYYGPNPHDKHAHFSASYDTAREASTASWHLEDLMALTADDWKRLGTEIDTRVKTQLDAFGKRDPLATMLARSSEQRVRMAELMGKDLVDEDAIVTGVLAGLDPAQIAAAVAAALPADQAQRVADELAARLAG